MRLALECTSSTAALAEPIVSAPKHGFNVPINRLLAGEVLRMALDTLRVNGLRSSLTILGVVIGITAIVGMTSLIRGFDQSLRDQVRQLGPGTIFVAKVSFVSLANGIELSEILRRPNLTVDDANAI